MRCASTCPICEGKQSVSRFFYEPIVDSDIGKEDAPLEDIVACRSCNGTGVVWPPDTEDALMSRLCDERWQPEALEFEPESDDPEPEWAPLNLGREDSFEELSAIVHRHSERQQIINVLHTLPADMPLMLLTPQALIEAITGDEVVQLLVLDSTWDQSVYERMVAYDRRSQS